MSISRGTLLEESWFARGNILYSIYYLAVGDLSTVCHPPTSCRLSRGIYYRQAPIREYLRYRQLAGDLGMGHWLISNFATPRVNWGNCSWRYRYIYICVIKSNVVLVRGLPRLPPCHHSTKAKKCMAIKSTSCCGTISYKYSAFCFVFLPSPPSIDYALWPWL